MYYKITNGDQTMLSDRLHYICAQENGVIRRCTAEKANGITLDGVNYHVDGMPAFPEGEYDTVTAEAITRAEYLVLADTLGLDVPPGVEDGALALARTEYIAMMLNVPMEETA